MKITFARLGFAALIVGSLAGCGGGGGGGGTPPAGGGSSGVTLPPPLTGTAVTVDYSNGAAQFPVMTPVITVGGAAVNSAPVIAFSLGDGNGNPYAGFDKIATLSGTVTTYPNTRFSIAKLVPGTSGSPSKWVSYIVTNTAGTQPQRPSYDNTGKLEYLGQGIYQYTFARDITKIRDQVHAICQAFDPTLPQPGTTGKCPGTGSPNEADLGDLTFDSTKLHRITIQFYGDAPGTGSNTPDGSNSGVTVVPMRNPVNAIYDFIPATGKAVAPTDAAVAQRLIVDKASCNECHGKLGGIPGTESESFHGGGRFDPKYCVVCHTDQRKYGRTNVASTSFAFPPITYDANGNITSASTYIADGVTVGDFPVLIHRVHKGEELIKQNYNFAGVLLNETKFPQDLRNCTKCHDNTAPKVAPQATNFQTVPSRLACGACHDGINFATGQGKTNNGKLIGHIGGVRTDDSLCALCHDPVSIKSVYHIPVTPPNPNNSLQVAGASANTHAAWIASNRDNLPPGAIKVSYEISSVVRNASMQPVIVFRALQDGVAKPFNDPLVKTELWDNFFGSPSVYFVWAVPQDGIAAPADFNVAASGWVKRIWNGTATGSSAGTITGPDANNYYTVTLTGAQVPDSAVMLYGGVGYNYALSSTTSPNGTPPLTQIGVSEPIASNNAVPSTSPHVTPRFGVTTSSLVGGTENKIGGLIVVTPNAQMLASGGAGVGGAGGNTPYTARRPIVEDARCNNCHKELGLFTVEAFHGGQRNDGSTCAWCHTPNRTSSGWSADASSYIHAIHASDKRTKAFTWHALAAPPNPKSFADIAFPGILSKCETCHLPNTYDFSAPASASALPNRLYKTVATGIFNATAGTSITTYTYNATTNPTCTVGAPGTLQTDLGVYSLSLPYVAALTNYGIGFSYNAGLTTANSCRPDGSGLVANPPGGTVQADPTTLVISPIATACFSCHDSDIAKQHMENEGGSIYRPRSTALAKTELCMFCHSPSSVYGLGIKAVHAK